MSPGKLDKLVFIFGVFAIIISLVASGACLMSYLYMVWRIAFDKYGKDFYIPVAVITVLLHFAVTSLVFSVLLVKGLNTKNPRLLRMYFIYGCLLILVCAVGSTVIGVWRQSGSLCVAFVLLSCSIYSVILAAVLSIQTKYQVIANKIEYQIINNQYLFLDSI